MSLLEKLLFGHEITSSLLIKDCVEFCGKWLIKSALVSLEENFQNIILLSYQEPPEKYLNGLSPELIDKIKKMECFSRKLDGETLIDYELDVLSLSRYWAESSCQKILIIIDSLTPLLKKKNVSYVCYKLQQLMENRREDQVMQIFAVVHNMVLDLTFLEDYFTTIFTIISTQTQQQFPMCHIIHKPQNKHLIDVVESFEVTNDYHLSSIKPVMEEKTLATMSMGQVNPSDNLTFNLTLSDSEKEARSHLHLPHMHHTKKLVNSESSHGHIFYEPEGNDYDEDPDDDLDF